MGSISFDVERFEQVAAGAGMVLLRVAGRWHADTATELDQPELVVDDGAEEHRLSMLPAPGAAPLSADPSGVTWRGAFSARGELLQGGRTFALHAGGDVLALPPPAPPSEAPPAPRIRKTRSARRACEPPWSSRRASMPRRGWPRSSAPWQRRSPNVPPWNGAPPRPSRPRRRPRRAPRRSRRPRLRSWRGCARRGTTPSGGPTQAPRRRSGSRPSESAWRRRWAS